VQKTSSGASIYILKGAVGKAENMGNIFSVGVAEGDTSTYSYDYVRGREYAESRLLPILNLGKFVPYVSRPLAVMACAMNGDYIEAQTWFDSTLSFDIFRRMNWDVENEEEARYFGLSAEVKHAASPTKKVWEKKVKDFVLDNKFIADESDAFFLGAGEMWFEIMHDRYGPRITYDILYAVVEYNALQALRMFKTDIIEQFHNINNAPETPFSREIVLSPEGMLTLYKRTLLEKYPRPGQGIFIMEGENYPPDYASEGPIPEADKEFTTFFMDFLKMKNLLLESKRSVGIDYTLGSFEYMLFKPFGTALMFAMESKNAELQELAFRYLWLAIEKRFELVRPEYRDNVFLKKQAVTPLKLFRAYMFNEHIFPNMRYIMLALNRALPGKTLPLDILGPQKIANFDEWWTKQKASESTIFAFIMESHEREINMVEEALRLAEEDATKK